MLVSHYISGLGFYGEVCCVWRWGARIGMVIITVPLTLPTPLCVLGLPFSLGFGHMACAGWWDMPGPSSSFSGLQCFALPTPPLLLPPP